MSAKAVPVAARLSRKDLALLRRLRGGGWVDVYFTEFKTARRLEGSFAELRSSRGIIYSARIEDAGLAALRLHRVR